MKKKIIGVVGHALSGKDTIAERLADKHGFKHISTGDLVRRHIADNNLGEPNRDLMILVGNELREKNGADVLIQRALEEEANALVISGIRAIAEARRVKREKGLIIASVSSTEIRYQRMKSRKRATDFISYEKFLEQETKETKGKTDESQNISAVVKMADFVIDNNGTIEEFYTQIDNIAVLISENS